MIKIKDELKFLKNLEELIGKDFLKSHKLKRKITKTDIFFEKDFRKYDLENKLNKLLKDLLLDFECNYNFSTGTLYQYIDGLIVNHKKYGTRIIEFDEEQHFTPFRLHSLNKISNFIDLPYYTEFKNLCKDIDYFNNEVLKKHRIKEKINQVSTDLNLFREFLEKYAVENYIKKNKKVNGYIIEKKEFNFIGGRIAQRAYFDLLREIAPFSKKNKAFNNTIRISKNKFEKIEHRPFTKIPDDRIKEIILQEIENQINYFA